MNLEDENFALKFELNALADLSILGKAERWVPGFMWKGIDEEHRSRYHLACNYVKGKNVLDVACGSGYGTYLLAEAGGASSVLGFDLDNHAVRYGSIRYAHENVKRQIQDVQDFNLPNTFDVVVSFETIEHLDDYQSFLKSTHSSLKAGGIIIISTPIVQMTRIKCDNPYHKIEWSLGDFKNLIGGYFCIDKIFVQSIQIKVNEGNGFTRILRKIVSEFRLPKSPVEENRYPVIFEGQYDESRIQYGYQIIIGSKKQL